MLESLYTEAIKKKGTISDKIKEYDNHKLDVSKFWNDELIPKNDENLIIAAGDGSKYGKNFLSFYFYAISAESLIYNQKISKDNISKNSISRDNVSKDRLSKVESSDINTMPHSEFAKDRIRNYMGLFEVKNAIKAIKTYNVDYYLYDGSLLGDLIRPSPLEKEIPQNMRYDILDLVEDKINNEINTIENHSVKVYSNELFYKELNDKIKFIQNNNKNNKDNKKEYNKNNNSSKNDKNNKNKDFNLENIENYLENIEKLLSLVKLLNYKDKIIAVSKTSTATDYFESNIPDMAIFSKYQNDSITGYSFPKYSYVEKNQLKREFPVENDFFKKLVFTIFYVRLEENKNILKIELPYKADNNKIKDIISVLCKDCTDGYPYLLKKAHHDVVIEKSDIEQLSKIIGIYEKSGREML